MTGRVEGKVAFITGAARGQGRSHAVRLAQEGADIIAVDICKPIREGVVDTAIPASTPEDLAETADLVKGHNRRIFTAEVDVRDYDALKAAVDNGVEQLGRLDIIVANAGIGNGGETLDKTSEEDWTEMIDINLAGVWKTVKAGVPHLLAGGHGGSIILTSSVGGLKAYPHTGHYVAAKHGVVGLMRAFAVELGQHMIRVNSVHPTHVKLPCCTTKAPSRCSDRIWRIPVRTTWRPSARCSTPCRFRGWSRRMSAMRCCSWHPTRHATSPVSRFPSTRVAA